MMIGDDNIESWAMDLSPEMGLWSGPFGSEMTKQNILSDAFSSINSYRLPTLEVVGEREGGLGFPAEPPDEEDEMDRGSGRFGGGGRFNRGGREGWQYKRREEGGDSYKNLNYREEI